MKGETFVFSFSVLSSSLHQFKNKVNKYGRFAYQISFGWLNSEYLVMTHFLNIIHDVYYAAPCCWMNSRKIFKFTNLL